MITSRTLASLSVVGALALVSCASGSDSGGDGAEASQEEICADVQSFSDAVAVVDGSENQDDALAAFDGAADAAGALSESVPAELTADVDLLAAALRTLADAETDEDVAAALQQLEEEELDAAGDRFGAYADEACGVEL